MNKFDIDRFTAITTLTVIIGMVVLGALVIGLFLTKVLVVVAMLVENFLKGLI